MNKITCDMCMDLMPLVRDGIASEDSRRAVEEHINYCDCCKKRYGEKITDFSVDVDLAQELAKLKRRLQIFSAMLMMLGVFFGLSLTASEDMFYNSLIMPVIGVLGYVIFRWKAVYQVPILLLVIQFLINFFGMVRGLEYMPVEIVMWVGIYSIFVELGVLVAGLLHFAFRR